MSRRHFALLVILIVVQPGFSSPALGARGSHREPGLEATVDSLARQAMNGWSAVPGVAIGVVDSGRVVLLKGYGVSATFLFPPVAGARALPASWGALQNERVGWTSPLRRLALSILAAGLLAFPLFLASRDLFRLPL